MSGFDPKCADLARYFLPRGAGDEDVKSLAKQIQQAVENWIADHEDDND